jgi:dihydrodiol dehydrogenase / D-xylose 1-dehydrogenase (NADP)
VSHDFSQALKHLPTARVVACSARDLSRAKIFAETHHIEQAYGTYEELVNDPNVDIVYVGNVHAFRLEIGGKLITKD